MSEMEKSAAENAGFTGEGFTGEGLTGQPAKGGADDLDDGGDYDLGVDPLMGEGSEKKSTKGVLILVLVVGLAAGSLFSMHTLTKVNAKPIGNDEVDRLVDKFLKGGDGNPDPTIITQQQIIDSMTHNYIENQVATLDRDPFALPGGNADTGDNSESLGRRAVEQAFNKLDLKSVIGGSRPLANINGKIVRVNQVMPVRLSKMEEIKFRVKEITRDSVTVEAVGIELKEPFIKKLTLKRRR